MEKTIGGSPDTTVLNDFARSSHREGATLEAAEHRVHRRHDEASRGFPCQGLLEPGACPVDGHIDVALAVCHRITPAPTSLEDGLRHIEHDGVRLNVHLALPVAVTRAVEQALAVRVLDAVRDTGRTFGVVDVHVHLR